MNHPILREAEVAFLRAVGDYPPGEAPGISGVTIYRDGWTRHRNAVGYSVRLLDDRTIAWQASLLDFQSRPPLLRSIEMLRPALAAVWDRVREEFRRAYGGDTQRETMAEGWRRLVDGNPDLIETTPARRWPVTPPDLRPGLVNPVERIPPPPLPNAYAEALRLQEQMYRDIRDIILYGAVDFRGPPPLNSAEAQERYRLRGCACPACDPSPEAAERRWLAAERAYEVESERQQRRIAADARSIALMEDWLTPEQLAEWRETQSFPVTSPSGNRYRIMAGYSFNVCPFDRDGNAKPALCFAPVGISAMGDIMLAQKIALETDEEAALKVANVERGRGVFPGGLAAWLGP